MKPRLHLNLFIYGRGHHEAAWRHPRSSSRSLMDIDHYIDCALKAEAAHFDSIFLADVLNLPPDVDSSARLWLEPLTALGAIAHAASHIGLIATASTSHTEPFNLARQFCSLDHISRGRVGWNVVTSFSIAGSRNFGGGRLTHSDRYDKGEEFMSVVTALWNSWSDDAVIDDRTTGTFLRKERVREVNHKGQIFEVAGPLNLPRSPQGWPVLVQAGSSDTGKAFAAHSRGSCVHRPYSKEHGQEILPGPQGASRCRRASRRPTPRSAGHQRDDWQHRGGGKATTARA